MKKICNVCEEEKSLEEFNKLKNGKFGKASRCKVCDRKRYQEWKLKNKDYLKERERLRYEIEKSDKRSLEFYYKHRDEILEKKRQQYIENPELFRDRRRKSYRKNRETNLDRSKKWRQENKAKLKSIKSKRYRQQSLFESKHKELIEQIYEVSVKMNLQVDHWIPLAKGGLHEWDNLVVLSSSTNHSKWAHNPEDIKNDNPDLWKTLLEEKTKSETILKPIINKYFYEYYRTQQS